MLNFPAALRNREPILNVLKSTLLPLLENNDSYNILEIASGSGDHVEYFAQHFPQITWQPTDIDPSYLTSIKEHIKSAELTNVRQPLSMDISQDFSSWEGHTGSYDAIYCANLIHISPFTCTVGLFSNAGRLLKSGGLLITYGPYAFDGVLTPESNVAFDQSLKSRNKEWGVRDVAELKIIASKNNIKLIKIHDMPANNKTLIWQKV